MFVMTIEKANMKKTNCRMLRVKRKNGISYPHNLTAQAGCVIGTSK